MQHTAYMGDTARWTFSRSGWHSSPIAKALLWNASTHGSFFQAETPADRPKFLPRRLHEIQTAVPYPIPSNNRSVRHGCGLTAHVAKSVPDKRSWAAI